MVRTSCCDCEVGSLRSQNEEKEGRKEGRKEGLYL
jgi:hypothetical protein